MLIQVVESPSCLVHGDAKRPASAPKMIRGKLGDFCDFSLADDIPDAVVALADVQLNFMMYGTP